MVERRLALGGRLQPAELALRARGRAHDRRGRPRGRARKAAPAAGPGRAAAVPGGGGRRRVVSRLGAAASGVGRVRPARWAAPLHRLLRGRFVRRQRLSLDLLGRGQTAPAAGRRLLPRAARACRPSAAPAARTASGRGAARGDARLHRWLGLAPALERRAPRTAARAGRPAAHREPRARDLAHRLSLELRAARRPQVAARHRRRRRGALTRARRAGAAGRARPARLRVGEVGGPRRAARRPRPGAPASTAWSSFTPEGRGAA